HSFPDTEIRLAQLRDSVVVEGQVRSTEQVAKVMEMVRSCLSAAQEVSDGGSGANMGGNSAAPMPSNNSSYALQTDLGQTSISVAGTRSSIKVINLLQV